MTEALKWPRTEVDLCSRWHISLPYVTCYIFYLFFGPLRNSYTLCSKKSDAKIQITSSTDILLGAALKPLLTFHQTHRSYQDGILWVKRHNQWIGFHSYFFLLAVTGYDFHHILFFFQQISSCSLCNQRMMICQRTWYWWSQNISSIWLWCATCNSFWNSLTSDCIDRHLSLLKMSVFYIYYMT